MNIPDNLNNAGNRKPGSFLKGSLPGWSVMLGSTGILADCCCSIWNLPGGIFFGIGGVVTAVLSKKGQPFTKQAHLGLVLSILAIAIGVILFGLMVFTFYKMKTDPYWASQAKLVYHMIQEWQKSLQSAAPGAP